MKENGRDNIPYTLPTIDTQNGELPSMILSQSARSLFIPHSHRFSFSHNGDLGLLSTCRHFHSRGKSEST